MKVLITGASRGIGAELAKNLAQHGHDLILVARSADLLDNVCKQCDILAGRQCSVSFAFDLIELLDDNNGFRERLNQLTDELDVLVNNAATFISKPFEEQNLKEERHSFDINYFAVVQLIRATLSLLRKKEQSSIINVTSMAAVQGSSKFPGLSTYSASKGALATLTECLAEEFKRDRIHVNALAFGTVQTEMLEEAFPGLRANTSAEEMGSFFSWFVMEGWKRFNGKMLPVAISTP